LLTSKNQSASWFWALARWGPIARVVPTKPGLALVGAYGRRRERAGMDVGHAIGLERHLDMQISPDLATLLERSQPHVAIQATCSCLVDAVEEIRMLIRHRVQAEGRRLVASGRSVG
jgi:hypothetical protein